MGRTKKLNSKISKNSKNSKISKSKRANKKKNVRISKKKVGGARRLSMTPVRRIPGTVARTPGEVGLSRSLTFERAGKTGVKAEGFSERRERERERIARKRAGDALRNLLLVMNEYKTSHDAGGLWINFLRSLRFKHIPGEIMLNYKILEHFRKSVLSHPRYSDIIQFLQGVAQAGERIYFTDAGYTKDGKLFATWLLEMLSNPQIKFTPFSIFSTSPV